MKERGFLITSFPTVDFGPKVKARLDELRGLGCTIDITYSQYRQSDTEPDTGVSIKVTPA